MDRAPDEIIRLVERHHEATQARRNLMERDHVKLWGLEAYKRPKENEGGRTYTSNEPRTYGRLAMAQLARSKMVIKAIQDDAVQEERERNNNGERVAVGFLRAVDERRQKLMLPPLKKAIPFTTCLRGFICGTWVIRKEEIKEADPSASPGEEAGDRTYPDVTLWDPMNTYWGYGKDGLEWACHKIMKTREKILAEYDVKMEGESEDNNPNEEFEVYDYWDGEHNKVVGNDTQPVELKKATPHGSPTIPVVIVPVGHMSQEFAGAGEPALWGESIYANNRGVYDEANFQYSVISQRAALADNAPLVYKSLEGNVTPDENPRETGADLALRTDQTVENFPIPEQIAEQAAFSGILAQERQRGSVPVTRFGELPSPISGFAINSLNVAQEDDFTPLLDAITAFYNLGTNLLLDQYRTWAFGAIVFTGQDTSPSRQFFRQEITPDQVGNGVIEIKFLPVLPQDDASRIAMAQGLLQNDIADMRYVREEIMGIQDPDLMEDATWEQKAARSHPLALAFNSMRAAEKRGEPELAQIYMIEAMRYSMEQQLQLMMTMMQAQGLMAPGGNSASPGDGGGGGGSSPAPKMPNLPSFVLPPEAMGIQSRPGMQSGPNVPAGTPRPGARTNGRVFQ